MTNTRGALRAPKLAAVALGAAILATALAAAPVQAATVKPAPVRTPPSIGNNNCIARPDSPHISRGVLRDHGFKTVDYKVKARCVDGKKHYVSVVATLWVCHFNRPPSFYPGGTLWLAFYGCQSKASVATGRTVGAKWETWTIPAGDHWPTGVGWWAGSTTVAWGGHVTWMKITSSAVRLNACGYCN